MRKILPLAVAAMTMVSVGAAAAQSSSTNPHAGHGNMSMPAPSQDGVKTTPADGWMSSTAPTVFTITFPHSMKLTSLTVATDGGRPVSIPVQAAAGTTVTTPLPALGKGNHVLTWSAEGADGHRMNGATRFMVH
ncbi:copper resistance CopC family protein [Brevundimonas sp.]|uniref:copper resistance CopC family protein n=1 Tax=Brevundimonas sp. TaxID=1871086 RepID=UPI002ED9B8B0